MGIFGGGGGGDAPKQPDPKKLIELQKQANLDIARKNAELNRINQFTPYGNVAYTNKGDRYTQTVTLPADAQAALSNTQAISKGLSGVGLNSLVPQISDTYSTPFNGDFSSYQRSAADAILGRLNPQIDRDRQSQISALADRGITPESNLDAYNRELDQFNRATTDARLQAELKGYDVGQQFFRNAITTRELPYNELAALLGSSQVQAPSTLNPGAVSVANTDVAGIYNQAYQNALGAQSNANAGLGNILGLAGTLGSAGIQNAGAFGSLFGGSGASTPPLTGFSN